MATYYVDGSVTSATGSGSGTIGDPWVKTDDLIQYAFAQINAIGYGANGDTIIVLAGPLTNTAELDPRVWDGSTNGSGLPIWIKTTSQTTIVDWDLGSSPLVYYPFQNINFAGFRFYNYSSSGSKAPFKVWRYCAFINCIFDSYAQTHYGMISQPSGLCLWTGCSFINDNRDNLGNSNRGIFYAGNSIFQNNYVEILSTNGTPTYPFNWNGSQVLNNVFYHTSDFTTYTHRWSQGAKASRNIFYNAGPAQDCIYNTGANNIGPIDNNYFEGWDVAIETNQSSRVSNEWIVGNKGYNNSGGLLSSNLVENVSTPFDFHDSYFKNETLSQSGLTDPANKDFTPNSLLLGTGFSTIKEGPSGVGNESENVGPILPNSATQRIRDLY